QNKRDKCSNNSHNNNHQTTTCTRMVTKPPERGRERDSTSEPDPKHSRQTARVNVQTTHESFPRGYTARVTNNTSTSTPGTTIKTNEGRERRRRIATPLVGK
ncbi:unnamed protein product, partial [Ectocarpus sp. 4 AP-2014]